MKKDSTKRKMTSFALDDDVAEIVKLADELGGVSLKELANEALRTYGPALLRKKVSEQHQRSAEFLARLDAKTKGAKPR